MVTPACFPSSDAGRRYSRACPPYPISYSDRRFHLSSQEGRTTTMMDRDFDSDSQPRKRIAVACGRCRKRKIRCSGDPGNGLPCTNCKNASHEPCLFLRVASTVTHLRNDGNDFGYNLDAARTYSNQSRVSVSQLSPIPQYNADISGGDVITSYRQNQYPYSSKGYISTISGWTNGYQDEVDYGLNYPYPVLGQDATHMVQGYGRYGSGKSVYVDSETTPYSYSSLVHRPAVSSESPTGFSLSGMATSLPSATDRVVPSDRLLPQVNRTLTGSSSYRADGLPPYSNSKTSPTSSLPEVGYGGLSSSFDQSYSTAPTSVPPSISHRLGGQHDGAAYQSSATAATDNIYSPSDHPLRSTEDTNSNLSYIYSDKPDGPRRDSHSSGGASSSSVLPNGHIYVPDSHVSSSQSYSSHSSILDGAPTSSDRGSGSSVSSHMHTDTHRRSAGNLRGG
ncbi:uncharacterized protein GGS22DRAFT_86999 [Annulohypoxylon maeteangense]|uniref:uncharacterized protein n=1 Tax=Annulohypoxylon maeteangense TaxID=1927788 RepID=UPI00200841DB|nr:uncharacterized protein GGS22DRAFT_86999 [Annulohypoxylon maeteangense]KAI0880211.1 hypothetical protein GGS22DRAFT_86999 [Annulohypoxylon maeteangense]